MSSSNGFTKLRTTFANTPSHLKTRIIWHHHLPSSILHLQVTGTADRAQVPGVSIFSAISNPQQCNHGSRTRLERSPSVGQRTESGNNMVLEEACSGAQGMNPEANPCSDRIRLPAALARLIIIMTWLPRQQ